MKQILYCSVLLWCVSYINAQPQEQFLHANYMYNAGDYQAAFDVYNAIPNKGRAVWYNMGNCAYKNKNYLDALIYWTRAERCATWSEYVDIQTNKAHAHHILGIPQPKKHIFESYQWCALPWYWSWFFIQSICVIIAMVLFVLWSRSVYRWQRISLLCMYILLCLGGYHLYRWYQIQHAQYAYVSDKSTNVYNRPDIRSHERGKLSYISKVCILEQLDDWSKIKAHGVTGWVQTTSLSVI